MIKDFLIMGGGVDKRIRCLSLINVEWVRFIELTLCILTNIK